MVQKMNNNTLKMKKINIKSLEDNLYTKHLPNPDILIRTGNIKDSVILCYGN